MGLSGFERELGFGFQGSFAASSEIGSRRDAACLCQQGEERGTGNQV